MEPNELVLLYGLSAAKAEGDKVQTLLREEKIPFREVLSQEQGVHVGALAGLDALDTCPPMVEPFSQSAMVFCGFSEQRLREALALLREAGTGTSSLKAVLTPNNRDWRFCDLLAELAKERDAFAQMMREKHAKEDGQTPKQDR